MKTRVSLKYLVKGCLWKTIFDFNSPQTTLNLISLKILVTLRPITVFLLKIRAIKYEKSAKICLPC